FQTQTIRARAMCRVRPATRVHEVLHSSLQTRKKMRTPYGTDIRRETFQQQSVPDSRLHRDRYYSLDTGEVKSPCLFLESASQPPLLIFPPRSPNPYKILQFSPQGPALLATTFSRIEA